MPSSYTTSLRLTLPATGELAGQWGSTVNTGITELLDAAVAGTTVISTWGGAGVPYTLSNNSGTADEARKMFLVATGTPGEAKNVICPAVSKLYVFRNDTTGGFALTLKTSGGTGIAVPAGQYKMLYCDGTNVVEAVNSAGALTLSGALSVGGTTTLASNPTLSAGTANGVLYLNGSKVATSGSALTFDGTNLATTGGVRLDNAQYYYGKNAAGSAVRLLGVNAGNVNYVGSIDSGPTEVNYGAATTITAQYWNVGGTEGMRLTSTGLGIGTSSPQSKFVVSNAGAQGIEFGYSAGLGANFLQSINRISGADVNMAYYLAGGGSHQFYNNGTLRATLDSSGNLGLGVTPSAWTVRALQVAGNATMSSVTGTDITYNAFYDGAWKYVSSARALLYSQVAGAGAHAWYTAPSGTAGNAISFSQALTLDANRNLLLNGTTAGASSVGTFTIFNGTAPTGSVTDGVILFAQDIASSSELRVRDEAGNVTTLSPHNFSLIPEGPSEEMAWAYYSEKGGKRINVDMLKLARMVEKLTGEKLVYEV